MTYTFAPPAKYQLGEEVSIPTGLGNVQFWLEDKEELFLVVSQTRKQTKLPPKSLWLLHYLKPSEVKKVAQGSK